jgi:molybdate transport system regulatory protein
MARSDSELAAGAFSARAGRWVGGRVEGRCTRRKKGCLNVPSKAIGGVHMAETQVSIRIDLETGGRIGPGKIALLEAISKTGSISAAARSINMSYRRAWSLVNATNKLLSKPAVTTAIGGASQGATLTPVGREIIQHYHSIEMLTRSAARREFQAFGKLLRG